MDSRNDARAGLQAARWQLRLLGGFALDDGIQPRVEGGRVEVRARYVDGLFELCVSNPYDAELAPASRGTRQALGNIDARLMALFGPQATLSSERRDGRHFTCLRYPCARLTQEARA